MLNVNHSLKIAKHVASVVTEKSSDHEEIDTKLIALVGGQILKMVKR